jgi:translation initiation factor IF-3
LSRLSLAANQAPRNDGPRVNREIDARTVRVIGADGENKGVLSLREALDMAAEAGLDLIEVSPNVEPPVCKILDYGKYKYEAQKKAAEARRNQKVVEVKEIKFRPGIDDNDYGVKLRAARRFIEEGDRIKVTLRFRGREMAHQDIGRGLLDRFRDDMAECAKIESLPRLEGKQMTMMIAPK